MLFRVPFKGLGNTVFQVQKKSKYCVSGCRGKRGWEYCVSMVHRKGLFNVPLRNSAFQSAEERVIIVFLSRILHFKV